MKNNNLLNDVFPEKKETPPNATRVNNINKFLECFTNSGKHKQIRILQIGGSGPTSLMKKPFLTTQPIKKTNNIPTGLFNS